VSFLKKIFKPLLGVGAAMLGAPLLGGASLFAGPATGSFGLPFGAGAGGGFWKTTLGKGIASVGTNVAESQLNSYFNMRRMQRLGMTPQEMYGAGIAGGPGSAGNMLGNNMAAKEMQERQFQQQSMMQDKALQAGIVQSQIAAGAQMYGADKNYAGTVYSADTQYALGAARNDIAWQEVVNEWAVNNPELNMRFKQMSMGVDNMVVELILQRNGLDISGRTQYSPAEFQRRMTSVMSEMAAAQGYLPLLREGARQGTAAVNDVLNAIQGGSNRPTLGATTPNMPKNPNPIRGMVR
jgi:hypothetical protein